MTDAAPPPFTGLTDTGLRPFDAPWQAQAFAVVLSLHESGAFTWQEWAETLSGEIEKAQALGDPDLGDTYYLHWLNALETISREKGLAGAAEMTERAEAWRRAYLATPHGKPVLLDNA